MTAAILDDFEIGYRLGFGAGWDVGYGYAVIELNAEFAGRIQVAPRVTPGPAYVELERLRAVLPEHRHRQPCSCARCSFALRHGGDHAGGPVVWEAAR